MSTPIPYANFVGFEGRWMIVGCPYCKGQHHHERPSRSEWRAVEHRAAACGLTLNQEDRARGYLINVI